MIFDIIKLVLNPPEINKDIYVTEAGGFGLKSIPLKERYFKMCKSFDKLQIRNYLEQNK